MNSFIITADGVSGIACGRPFTAESSHVNYHEIIVALKGKAFDKIEGLINITRRIADFVGVNSGRIQVDPVAGIVLFQGMEIHNVLTKRILDMMEEGFDISPMVKLLDNMLENPSCAAIPRLYDWMEAGKLPITEDGCFIAFKRVSDDLTSFHDRNTVHVIGQRTEMPRSQCDENQNNTCSSGLHFCSQGYLPSYCGGQGRVLVLKIHPRDVVAIPFEYGTHKGRCCAYTVIGELTNDYRQRVETENPLTQSVVTDYTNYGTTADFHQGYVDGYRDGKAKDYYLADDLAADFKEATDCFDISTEYARGYIDGHKDGRGHKPKLYK